MKRIAVFCDGTWADPENDIPTNVLRMARAVQPLAPDGTEQVAFYDWGVGTDRKKIAGGISGAGIDKNIMDCYRFLVHNYDPGDQLYFFGFSRGAYTARSLGGFIRNCGLLRREHASRIPEAFDLYRKRTRASSPGAAKPTAFRRDYAVADKTGIDFVGVWDTVGALGIPLPFWGTLGEREFLFHDTEPSSIIKRARHAVSIDENRRDFEPTLWAEKDGLDLRQVWFAGVHSDVGGGYKEDFLSAIALGWIVREAANSQLAFEDHLFRAIESPPDGGTRPYKLHKSRKGIYLAKRAKGRKISGPGHRSVRALWDADPQYRRKKGALNALLNDVGHDWSRIEVVE